MYQKLILVGNLGSDPTMKYTTDGKCEDYQPKSINQKQEQ